MGGCDAVWYSCSAVDVYFLSGYVGEVADHNTHAGGVQWQGVRVRCLQLLQISIDKLAATYLELWCCLTVICDLQVVL